MWFILKLCSYLCLFPCFYTVLLLDPNLGERVPDITYNETTDQALPTPVEIETTLVRYSLSNSDQTNLEWQVFDGSLPDGAVSIYNGYVGRIDYVCQYNCIAGFYNPGMDSTPSCHYPYGDKAYLGSPFEILVNKNNFEFLEWKKGSYGSVPQNSVRTCSKGIYVGKNMYGLGKVDVKNEAFFLPWKGAEYWYKDCQVLTFSKDIYSEDISDVKYKTDGVKIITSPPETMGKAILTNKDCQKSSQTATLSKKIQEEQRWDTSSSTTVGIKTTITAGIPDIASVSIEIGAETTRQLSKGTTYTESKDFIVSVQHDVPPNHSCVVTMLGYKYEADIPYTGRLHRTYSNGDTTWTSISGTYKGVQIGEVRSVVERCEPVPDPTPCP
ncbi:natterin-3-like [Anarrhichthys ocellatus]|uniref:natterin-3-like n=1 Tax=Anarrhichthys ocellatus TaxID=433405 RepID=UPI0012EEB5A1|nr:natterin-3-like [Anarrhichthys ocellatus]